MGEDFFRGKQGAKTYFGKTRGEDFFRENKGRRLFSGKQGVNTFSEKTRRKIFISTRGRAPTFSAQIFAKPGYRKIYLLLYILRYQLPVVFIASSPLENPGIQGENNERKIGSILLRHRQLFREYQEG